MDNIYKIIPGHRVAQKRADRRTGIVVQVDDARHRVQVLWTHDRNGNQLTKAGRPYVSGGVRTWTQIHAIDWIN